MYSPLNEVLTRALDAIRSAPKSKLIQRKSQREDANELLKLVGRFENVHLAARDLARSAMYYRQHDWQSNVAKRMRKQRLCGQSTDLAKYLTVIGKPLDYILGRLKRKHCRRDLMDYLIGVQSLERRLKLGAPTLSPIFKSEKTDDEDSSLMITYPSQNVDAKKYGQADLQKYVDGDYSPFPFLKTIKLDSDEADAIIAEAISGLSALEKLCHDYREWFRQTITIDDLIAEVAR